MPVRVATHPQGDKAQARSERIAEIVSARGQHAERIGCQAHADESEDHDHVDDQHKAKAFVWRQESLLGTVRRSVAAGPPQGPIMRVVDSPDIVR